MDNKALAEIGELFAYMHAITVTRADISESKASSSLGG